MKKIVIDARSITNNSDGLGYYSIFMINRIIKKYLMNHNLCIVISPTSSDLIHNEYLAKGIEVVIAHQERFNKSYTFDFQEWDDMVCSISPDIYISTAFFGTSYKCTRIVVIHDLVPIIWQEKINPKKAVFFQHTIDRSIHGSDLLITPSDYTARDIRKYFPSTSADIKVLYPDVQAFLDKVDYPFSLSSNSICPYFLVVGVKCPRKNIEVVIEAIRILKSKNRCYFKVYFVGNTREEDLPIKSLIKKSNIQDIAIVTGYLSEEKMREIMKNSCGLIFPSQYEGFGIPLLEFLGLYKPIICMRNSSIPEVVEDLAYYVQNDANMFANAIVKILSSPPNLNRDKVDNHLKKLVAVNNSQYNDFFNWIQCNAFDKP
jgi:glycosyltransferase involved in cell wall biosynthesis